MPEIEPAELIAGKRIALIAALDVADALAEPLAQAADQMTASIRGGGKLLVAGNGGSAAEAQHFTGELVGRFMQERSGIAAICLHADTSAVTAIGNDYGYERVFARQVEAIGNSGDTLLVLSTSGSSRNLIEAVETARRKEIATVGLLGNTRRDLHEMVDVSIPVTSDYQPAVQEMHLFLVHALAELIETELFG